MDPGKGVESCSICLTKTKTWHLFVKATEVTINMWGQLAILTVLYREDDSETLKPKLK